MKLILRTAYLQKMIAVMGTPDIKIITGVRRSGKSKLLEAFAEYVKAHVANANVIHINFNLLRFEEYKEAHALHDFIGKSFVKGCENFVLIDEIQMCKGFELAVNSLHAMEQYDIYITGSNAFLLSSDLATLFTGRSYEIRVFPFSFAEFMQYFDLQDNYAAFELYLKEGGMAGSYLYSDPDARDGYIREVFDTLLRDIRQKYKIRNSALMDRVADFMTDNISSRISARSIAERLSSDGEHSCGNINHKTAGSYLSYLCNSFAFYKFSRYDIRAKKYLASDDKYYLSDHSFCYARLGTRNPDHGRVLENIVAIELLRRGFEVYVGVLYKKEIDFVAVHRSEKLYIQVSDNISDEEIFAREVRPLLQIRDAYPKMVIARTGYEPYQYEGIRIIDIADWLSGS